MLPFDPGLERYVSLATWRKSGARVLTPVWIAGLGGKFYVFSEGKAGKVKRIRANGRVAMAPCDVRGNIRREDWIEGRARVLPAGEDLTAIYASFSRKYGMQMWVTNFFSKLSGRISRRAIIEIDNLRIAEQAPVDVIANAFRSGSILLAGLLLVAHPARADVEVTGVSSEIAQAVRAGISIADDCSAARWLVRYRFGSSERDVRAALQTFGYYSPRIDSDLSFDDNCWHARYRIDPGEPVILRQVDVSFEGEAHSQDTFRELLKQSGVRVGTPFDHERYEQLKSSIESLATRLGYLEGTFTTRKVTVDPETHEAKVSLVFDSGPRYHFGEVSFQTDGREMDQDLLHRYVQFAQGDPYDADRVGDLYKSLSESGYFQDVIIDTSRIEDTAINVDVRLIIGDPSVTRVGIGYSTDLGPSAFIGRNSRLVNRHGHQLNLDLSVSPVQRKVGGYYRIPQEHVTDGWFSVYGGLQSDHTDSSNSSKTTLGIRHIRPRPGGWVETRFFEILNYQFDVASDQQSNVSFVPGISFSHTESDSVGARPRRAHRLDFEVSGTSTAIGSTADYLRFTASEKFIHGLTTNSRFLGRAKVGAVLSDSFNLLPPDVRFFAGGDNSVRGYDFEEIGALDASGNVIGGNRLIEASAEFDYLVRPRWAVAGFVDAASVSLGAFSDSFNRAVGVGVRWYSPIGPIRFDIAKPLDGGNSVRLHITLGPDV